MSKVPPGAWTRNGSPNDLVCNGFGEAGPRVIGDGHGGWNTVMVGDVHLARVRGLEAAMMHAKRAFCNCYVGKSWPVSQVAP